MPSTHYVETWTDGKRHWKAVTEDDFNDLAAKLATLRAALTEARRAMRRAADETWKNPHVARETLEAAIAPIILLERAALTSTEGRKCDRCGKPAAECADAMGEPTTLEELGGR